MRHTQDLLWDLCTIKRAPDELGFRGVKGTLLVHRPVSWLCSTETTIKLALLGETTHKITDILALQRSFQPSRSERNSKALLINCILDESKPRDPHSRFVSPRDHHGGPVYDIIFPDEMLCKGVYWCNRQLHSQHCRLLSVCACDAKRPTEQGDKQDTHWREFQHSHTFV